MTSRPPVDIRRQVAERARNYCEYCLISQDYTGSAHQIDHIIAEKHGGQTTMDNLALSCTLCNRRKGSDISSLDPETGEVVPLFHPRIQNWIDHFKLDGFQIVGLTPEGRTTVEFLQLNSFERLMERAELIRAERYPPKTL